jgi:hypothetical protein
VYDRQLGTSELVSRTTTGGLPNDNADFADISADGRYVVWMSRANNIVPGYGNLTNQQVYLRDRQLGTTKILSVSPTGVQANNQVYRAAISGDGRRVVFSTAATNLTPDNLGTSGYLHIFLRDLTTNQTQLVSKTWNGTIANNSSYEPTLSAEGRYVAFYTDATNMVAGDTNGFVDVLVRDMQTGITAPVVYTANGVQANSHNFLNALSDDGRRVTFNAYDGNYVPGDTNGFVDVFSAPNPLW